jgi:hypothetical protein
MRGFRWLALIALMGWCVPLLGCSTPTTQPPKLPSNDKNTVQKPNPDPG